MATLDEIFASMPDTPAGGTHELLIIDPDTRQIHIPEIESVFGVITDGNAEKKYFQCPRYVGKGIDLAACKLRITFQNASGTEEGRDGYLVTDTTESNGYVYFSWELSPKVCLYQGAVQFAVCAMLGNTVAWHTTLATGTVLDGMEYNGEIVQTEMQDVIAQLIALAEAQSAAVEAAGAAQVQKINAARASALVEINAAAANAATAIVCHAEGAAIQVADASDRPLQGLRIFGRSTQDGTPTPDSPVEIVSTPAPVVTVCGKNLCATESVTLTGSAIAIPVFEGAVPLPCVLSWVQDFAWSAGAAMFSYVVDGSERYQSAGETAGAQQFAIANGGVLTKVTVLNWGEETGTLSNMQLETGTEPTEYEPYTGQTVTLTNGLPGIPVSSGGNYTDADGQQWICDEVDLTRGVYAKRVGSASVNIESVGSLETGFVFGVYNVPGKKYAPRNGVISSAAEYVTSSKATYGTCYENAMNVVFIGSTDETLETLAEKYNGSNLLYVLAEPIETPLTEAELAAFAALHSVKPTTTILNDSGACMAVEYVADTKLYIDSKLAELVAAMNA